MVSTISFVQANLQHSTAASRILTRTIGIKGIDMALIQEPWCRGGCIRGLNIPGYPVFCEWDRKTSGLHFYKERDSLDVARILF